jgi:hypothetical protein
MKDTYVSAPSSFAVDRKPDGWKEKERPNEKRETSEGRLSKSLLHARVSPVGDSRATALASFFV